MKQIILLCLSLAALASFAQTCKISGTTNDTTVKEVYLFLLEGDTYFTSPSASIPVAANGSFSSKVPVNAPVFARLIAGNKGQRLIVSAGRDVNIAFNPVLHIQNTITGKGATENNLINNSVLSNAPFFIKRKWTATELTPANWRQNILQVVERDIQETAQQIQKSNVPANIKTILTSEVTYAYQCYLSDLANIYLYQSAIQWKPLPYSQALASGFYASMIVEMHSSYGLGSLRKTSSREKFKADFAAYLKMQSAYFAKAKADMLQMEVTIKNNTTNKHIVFKASNHIQSLSELIAPYKGKVVYLDSREKIYAQLDKVL